MVKNRMKVQHGIFYFRS